MEAIKFLEGPKVYLRPIEEEDLDSFYQQALWNKEGRRLTGTQQVFSRKGLQEWFETNATDNSRIDLLICLQENGQVIGDVALLDIDRQNRNAIIRISVFNQTYWDGGYGTEALSLLVEFGFNIVNLHRIGLDVFAYNTRAKKSYEKLGFSKEGIIRDALFYDGSYWDSLLMGVLKEEFIKNH